VETPSNPALLFSHSVAIKGQEWKEVVVYAYRQGDNNWVTEDIVEDSKLEIGDIQGHSAEFSMNYFYDGAAWVPTVAYITTTQWDDPIVTRGVVLAERQEDAGQVTWPAEPVLECDDQGPTSARMETVRLRRGADGSLHAMVHMRNDSGTWGLVMHRDRLDGTWEHQRTGWFDTVDFDVDSEGNYYVAGKAIDPVSANEMLALLENLDPIVAGDACDPPNYTVSDANADIADRSGVDDIFLENNVPEGPIVGKSDQFNAYGIHLTGDDGLSDPTVHIFQISNTGNTDVSEVRVLSRCAPGTPGTWIRDAADRIHWDGDLDSRNFAVSENGIAWAYNYGRSRKRHDWKFEGSETMFLGQRSGNACQLAN